MVFETNNKSGFSSRKKRSLTWYLNKLILITLSIILGYMALFSGGASSSSQLIIVPSFGFLMLLHGLFIFLKSNSLRYKKGYTVSLFPLVFAPFLIWLFVSENFISPVPWRAHIHFIYFFEAFIVLWIISNHIKKLRDLMPILISLGIALLIHIFFGLDQFFHSRNMSEIGIQKSVHGLFGNSISYLLMNSILIAALVPMVFLKLWPIIPRIVLGIILLLAFVTSISAHNIQGYWILLWALICSSALLSLNFPQRIRFLLVIFSFGGLLYGSFYLFISTFGDYYLLPFQYNGESYSFKVFVCSLFLILKNFIFGVGLDGFAEGFYSIQISQLPLVVDSPSNFYTLIFSELGIIGFVLLSYPVLKCTQLQWKKYKTIKHWEFVDRYKKVPLSRFYLSIVFSVIFTFIFAGFVHSLVHAPIFICFFILAFYILNLNHNIDYFYIIRKSASHYLFLVCTILLGFLFTYDGLKTFKSQSVLEVAQGDFENLVFSGNDYDDNLLDQTIVGLVNKSILCNPNNIDSWVLKSELLNELYNYNPIKYSSYPSEMLDISENALKASKRYWKTWLRYAISLAILGQSKEAEDAFKCSLDLAPYNFDLNLYMALYYYQTNKRYKEAQIFLDKALSIRPNQSDALGLFRKLSL